MRSELLAFAAIAVLGTGCATTTNGPSAVSSNTAPLPPAPEETAVQVENHNWSDMVVYAVRDNHRVRLGMVTSMNSRRFEIPTSFGISTSDLQFMVSPIGSPGSFMMGPVVVNPGQTVELRLENTLSISNWAVW